MKGLVRPAPSEHVLGSGEDQACLFVCLVSVCFCNKKFFKLW